MTEPQEQTAVPSHWHVFRRDESDVKQYMLPIYSKQSEALAAVAALKMHDPRNYEVEECQDPACHR
jgi:bifunctional DNase/RNase